MTTTDYIVTARKWRPMKFDDVAAQNHVTVTLRNAISTQRLAHAYLFSGPRGVGKTTTARLLAKAVNCLHPVDNNPDNTCELCIEITEGRSFDVLEIDGASNRGVEEIRNLRESVRYAPARGKYKVYIIDEVHMLTKEAFNALLKTLEEPPPHVLFVFATTEIQKLPATIVSRCQRFDFRRIAIDEIVVNLKGIAAAEGLRIDDDALLLVAKKGDGSLRDAQSIFDQVVALCGRHITQQQILDALHIVDQELYFRVTDLMKAGDARGGLALVDEIMTRGYDIKEFLAGFIEHLRNLLIATTSGSTTLIEVSEHHRKRYSEEVRFFPTATLLRLIRFVNDTDASIRTTTQPRFRLEADIVQMILMPDAPEISELLQRIDEMKKKLQEGEPVQRARPAETDSKPSSVRVAVAPLPVETNTTPVISESEVLARWPEFVNEVRRHRISLGSVLESAALVSVTGGILRLRCANEFQASSIKRNKELLGGIVHSVFNIHARCEVEIVESGRQSSVSAEQHPQGEVSGDQHPVIKAMIKELGAEPL